MQKRESDMKRLFGYLKKDYPKLVLVSILSALSAAFVIFGPVVLGDTTSVLAGSVIDGGTFGADVLSRVLLGVIIAGALYVLSSVFEVLQGYVLCGIAQRLTLTLRGLIIQKLNKLPFSYLESKSVGDIMSAATNDAEIVGNSFSEVVSQLGNTLISSLGMIVVMFVVCPILALIVILTIPLRLIYVAYNMKKSAVYYQAQQERIAQINGHVEEHFTGFETIKAYGNEDESIRKFEDINKELYKVSDKSFFMSAMINPIMLAIGNFGYIGILIAGTLLCINGSIEIGIIQTFLQYVNSINAPIQKIATTANKFQSMKAAFKRIVDILDAEEETDLETQAQMGDDAIEAADMENDAAADGTQASADETKAEVGNISFENISFGYNPDQIIINDFSLDVHKGQMIAIVGPTGAGKTTIIKLLMRFYDVNSGEIRLDGKRIKELSRKTYRKNFAFVLQETWLFSGTIRENLEFGRPGATAEEVERAARLAKADDFIRLLPGGYDFEIKEDGANLSIGQRQLLTIARAFVADCPLLILDEATSSVDTRTELKVQEAMSTLMKGRTCFVIAHRLSTIRNADVILVLKDGNIVEKGSHEQLMESKGFYYELNAVQSEG